MSHNIKKGDMIVRIPEYFEFKEGNSSKFWEIHQCSLTSFTTSWGRIGSKGQSSTRTCPSQWSSNALFHNIRRKKQTKGYRLKERPKQRQKLDDQTEYYLVLKAQGRHFVLLDPDGATIISRDKNLYQVICDN